MPEFFLELFSEEIPARMQREAGVQLEKICSAALAGLKIQVLEVFTGPRRIAIKAIVNEATEAREIEERGPRESAPEAALAGFLGKHKAIRADVVAEGGFFLLRRRQDSVAAADLIFATLPGALQKFAWPKSMRWGQSGEFTWVRPLRRVVCLLDGVTVPIAVGPVVAGNLTEGHRFLAAGTFEVVSAADWQAKLRERFVIADQNERREKVVTGLAAQAAAVGLMVAEDAGLVEEVTGLVEWPVALVGRIDDDFMELPPEVRELSMRLNQRFFALRDKAGKPVARFAFVSNIEAEDGNKAIVAGNERVLRARLSDARHFWDLDLKTPLCELLPKLDQVTFHTKLGSQGDRVRRICDGACRIGIQFGQTLQDKTYEWSQRAALLSKCDLLTGMVGEFPELQGIIGSYYARENGEKQEVADAIGMQYLPRGPKDRVPSAPVAINLSLADKFDQVVAFFAIGERPTGSGDPYALRRAGLGIIRIILENELECDLRRPIHDALEMVRSAPATNVADIALKKDIFEFLIDRLKVKLRGEGKRFDVLDAAFAINPDGDILQLMKRVNAITTFILTEDGKNLRAGYQRATSILRIEDARDGPHTSKPLLTNDSVSEERNLRATLEEVDQAVRRLASTGQYQEAMNALASLRKPVDVFFEQVKVNDSNPKLRHNRLALLAQLRDTMHLIADFSKIEG